MTFGDRIRRLRKARKLTMKQVGDKLGLAVSTVAGHEKNERIPDVATTRKYADFFGVTVDELINGELTERDKEFLGDVELNDQEIVKKFNLTVDGQEVDENELKAMIAYVRIIRQD